METNLGYVLEATSPGSCGSRTRLFTGSKHQERTETTPRRPRQHFIPPRCDAAASRLFVEKGRIHPSWTNRTGLDRPGRDRTGTPQLTSSMTWSSRTVATLSSSGKPSISASASAWQIRIITSAYR